MNDRARNDDLPAWHRFEIVIRDALSQVLPKGNHCGLLMNRRLGWENSTEADLMYPGTIDGDPVLIIVECKNRPIRIEGGAIFFTGENPVDIAPSLERKRFDARNNLGIRDVRFLVVAASQTAFVEKLRSDCFVVGQPIQRWIRDSTTAQDFVPLEQAWSAMAEGLVPVPLDGQLVELLRKLPRFSPWDDPAKTQARELHRAQQELDNATDFYSKEIEEEWLERSHLLRQRESELEEGWYYPDDSA